jgi:hypothetical protein
VEAVAEVIHPDPAAVIVQAAEVVAAVSLAVVVVLVVAVVVEDGKNNIPQSGFSDFMDKRLK